MDLVVFAREPVPGRVKTRLAAGIGPEAAAGLYGAFVADLCGRLAAGGRFRPVAAADPGPDAPFFKDLAAAGLPVVPQGGGDLGERMGRALRGALDGGAEGCLLIGTDVPTLPVTHLEAAAAALARAPLVLGPSSDGGYYLVGASRAALPRWGDVTARLFTGIPWGGDDVLHRTLARAGDLAVALAPAWYDVDEAADLALLARQVAADAKGLDHTAAALARLPAGAEVP